MKKSKMNTQQFVTREEFDSIKKTLEQIQQAITKVEPPKILLKSIDDFTNDCISDPDELGYENYYGVFQHGGKTRFCGSTNCKSESGLQQVLSNRAKEYHLPSVMAIMQCRESKSIGGKSNNLLNLLNFLKECITLDGLMANKFYGVFLHNHTVYFRGLDSMVHLFKTDNDYCYMPNRVTIMQYFKTINTNSWNIVKPKKSTNEFIKDHCYRFSDLSNLYYGMFEHNDQIYFYAHGCNSVDEVKQGLRNAAELYEIPTNMTIILNHHC